LKFPQNENPNILGAIGTDIMFDNVMEKWVWGNMDDVEHGIYMDENNRRMVTNIRLQMANLAETLLKQGEAERSIVVLDEMMRAMPRQNVPYSRVIMPVAEAYMQLASDTTLAPNTKELSDGSRASAWASAQKIADEFMAMQEDNIRYFTSLDANLFMASEREIQFSLQVADRLVRVMKYFHPDTEEARALEGRLTEMESDLEAYEQSQMNMAGGPI
jgi:hypothetical protein